jgi:hypothetical protein
MFLSLNQIAELFERDKSVISKHLKNIFDEEELDRDSTVALFATVQDEGGRNVTRNIEYFNLAQQHVFSYYGIPRMGFGSQAISAEYYSSFLRFCLLCSGLNFGGYLIFYKFLHKLSIKFSNSK